MIQELRNGNCSLNSYGNELAIQQVSNLLDSCHEVLLLLELKVPVFAINPACPGLENGTVTLETLVNVGFEYVLHKIVHYFLSVVSVLFVQVSKGKEEGLSWLLLPKQLLQVSLYRLKIVLQVDRWKTISLGSILEGTDLLDEIRQLALDIELVCIGLKANEFYWVVVEGLNIFVAHHEKGERDAEQNLLSVVPQQVASLLEPQAHA